MGRRAAWLASTPPDDCADRVGGGAGHPERVPFTVIDQAVHLLDTPAEPWGLLGPEALRRLAARFEADLLALAEARR